ncbi:hypothetical protein LPJ71_008159, partial [Coemansia sp. S17]
MSQPFVAVRHDAVTIELMLPAAHASSAKELANTFRANALEAISAIELHASFILHCVNCGSSKVALAVFDTFRQTYDTATNDIHIVIQAHGLDEAAARRVLKGYFSAWPIVNSHIIPSFIGAGARLPALFTAESNGLMAMFGGQ